MHSELTAMALGNPSALALSASGQLAVPVLGRDALCGLMLFGLAGKALMDGEEKDFLAAMDSSRGIAIDNIYHSEALAERARLEADMAIVKAVQDSLIPHRDLELSALQISSPMEPAEQTGGDWFGYHVDQVGKRAFIFVGDVTGLGISSALVTGVVAGSIFGGERLADRISMK